MTVKCLKMCVIFGKPPKTVKRKIRQIVREGSWNTKRICVGTQKLTSANEEW